MPQTREKLAALDPVWSRIREQAETAARNEPIMAGFFQSAVLLHDSFEAALAARLGEVLGSDMLPAQVMRDLVARALADDPSIGTAARADTVAIYDRDPACTEFLQPLIYFKGFRAVQAYRVAHWLWKQGRRDLAMYVQARVSQRYSVDIHPAARIGKGIMIDHAHAIVVGETAVVGDNVSMLHGVTLGGTGKEDGDRHPKIECGVLIGAGAKVLGNITVGACARVAAGSVVLADVPPKKTVAGVPARIVGDAGCDTPSVTMDQLLRDAR